MYLGPSFDAGLTLGQEEMASYSAGRKGGRLSFPPY
jgi:hypothetical protein